MVQKNESDECPIPSESLRRLSIIRLFDLIKEHEDCKKAVFEIVKPIFSQKWIIFNEFSHRKYDFEVDSESITIQDPLNMITVLEGIGESIRKLSIQAVSGASIQVKPVIELVTKHCSVSLEKIYLAGINYKIFESVTTKFDNVKIVSLAGLIGSLGNEKFSFFELFPKICELDLFDLKIHSSNNLIIKIPQLEKISYGQRHIGDDNDLLFEKIIKINPQIRNVTFYNIQPKLLKFISNQLLNLEYLELQHYQHHSNNINHSYHFENVKVFKIDNGLDSSWPNNLTFSDKLEEFNVDYFWTNPDAIDLIELHPNLKKLYIHGYNPVGNNDLKRLIAINLSVTEMALYFGYSIENNLIVQLIKNCNQLNKIHLNRFISNQSEINEFIQILRKHFESEWNIEIDDVNYYLERKN